MDIPLLVVSNGSSNLVDLAEDFEMLGVSDGLLVHIAEDSRGAVQVYRELGPKLMLSLLPRDGLEAYDSLVSAGYQEKFRVITYSGENPNWAIERGLPLLVVNPSSNGPDRKIIDNYMTIMNDILS